MHQKAKDFRLEFVIRWARSGHSLGASWTGEGINFAVISKHATLVSLTVYHLNEPQSIATLKLDPTMHLTGDHWHILVKGLPPVFRYAWHVDGPARPGHAFTPEIPSWTLPPRPLLVERFGEFLVQKEGFRCFKGEITSGKRIVIRQ